MAAIVNSCRAALLCGILLLVPTQAGSEPAPPRAKSKPAGDSIHVEARGRLAKALGERDAYRIRAAGVAWEVDVSRSEALRGRAKELEGRHAIVTGSYEERGRRRIVLARRLEPGRGRGGSIDVTVRGTLDTGVMAIGAETTGVTITSKGVTWDLELDERQLEVAEKLAGRKVTISGRLRHHAGVEIRDRFIVKVSAIASPG